MPSLLLTGPLRGLDRYAMAARAAGWEPVAVPLIEVRPRGIEVGAAPDWLVVTSASAAEALAPHVERLRGVPLAVVGERTAEALAALGLAAAFDPAPDAASLLAALRPRLRAGARVLWPRGSASAELAEALARDGHAVDAPVAYETVELASGPPLPATDAVFLASPSALRAYLRRAREAGAPPAALAIGPTTAAALEGVQDLEPPPFRATVTLARPAAEALAAALAALPADPDRETP